MKILLIVLVMLNFTACAQNSQNSKLVTQKTVTNKKTTMEKTNTEEEKEVIAVTNKLSELMMARDLNGMDKILDEDYSLTHITGYHQSKKEWFDEVRKESMKYYSVEEVSKLVKIDGNKAEVIDRNLVDARIWGSRNTWRLQQILKFEKRDGKWIILESVASTF
ncbi:MAG: nuclear transport factor 2 family protein [Weeksellaceae bacterium]|nr:nuclear transport factor 2 family protein [Weeksellaceae bacterium]